MSSGFDAHWCGCIAAAAALSTLNGWLWAAGCSERCGVETVEYHSNRCAHRRHRSLCRRRRTHWYVCGRRYDHSVIYQVDRYMTLFRLPVRWLAVWVFGGAEYRRKRRAVSVCVVGGCVSMWARIVRKCLAITDAQWNEPNRHSVPVGGWIHLFIRNELKRAGMLTVWAFSYL